MLTLYFRPMACSLASRIALLEAGIEARYVAVDLASKTIEDGAGDFLKISTKGRVPVLELADGERLTENAAVLQYIADQAPHSGLWPEAGPLDRYRQQEWLSFIGSEVHKAIVFPMFSPNATEAEKEPALKRASSALAIIAARLEDRPALLGKQFSVADAYLVWALLLLRYAGVELPASIAAYLDVMRARPAVLEAIAAERKLLAN